MKISLAKLVLVPAVAMVFLTSGQKAQAVANNNPPPAGNVILDLAGQAVPHGAYQQYTTTFTASMALTEFSIAQREDPAYIYLDDVSVTDITHPGGNLLVNGGFESGIAGNNAPVGWTYLNIFGAGAAGVVTQGGARTGSYCYVDGAVQAYDAIYQTLGLTVGDTYSVSLWITDNGGLTTFQQLSTNGDTTSPGGNGIDLLVYAGALPTAADAPDGGSTVALFGMALSGLALVRSRLRK